MKTRQLIRKEEKVITLPLIGMVTLAWVAIANFLLLAIGLLFGTEERQDDETIAYYGSGRVIGLILISLMVSAAVIATITVIVSTE